MSTVDRKRLCRFLIASIAPSLEGCMSRVVNGNGIAQFIQARFSPAVRLDLSEADSLCAAELQLPAFNLVDVARHSM